MAEGKGFIAVLGGDRREGFAAARLAAGGWRVTTFGCPLPEGCESLAAPDAPTAVDGVSAVLAPALGADEDGVLHHLPEHPAVRLDAGLLGRVPRGIPLLTGRRGPGFSAAVAAGLRLVEYGQEEDYVLLNAVPSAEGAILEAQCAGGRTVAGARAVVTGYGRTGEALARCLLALGARVTVAARGGVARARAETAGCAATPFQGLPDAARRAHLAFNTVPACVWTEPALAALPRGAVLIDIASGPGGVDWRAARYLGVPASQALGLPGRYFPRTAGDIVARVAARLLAEPGAGGEAR
jgi:dipicolinate synthase subunit A